MHIPCIGARGGRREDAGVDDGAHRQGAPLRRLTLTLTLTLTLILTLTLTLTLALALTLTLTRSTSMLARPSPRRAQA
eukprot:scaffold70468_cov43-Phaeocystis_antarctica.AAC.3